jgi:hypothetical protein
VGTAHECFIKSLHRLGSHLEPSNAVATAGKVEPASAVEQFSIFPRIQSALDSSKYAELQQFLNQWCRLKQYHEARFSEPLESCKKYGFIFPIQYKEA